jgi:hypothetical protein
LTASRSEKKRRSSPMKGNEEDHLISMIKENIRIETDLENAKQSQSLKADFNLFDAFRLFDKHNIGYLYRSDLIEGLNRIGVYGP